MMKFMANRVLAPTDFSDQAHRGVDLARSMVQRAEDLTIVHVAPPAESFGAGDPALAWQVVSDQARSDDLTQMLARQFSDPQYEGVNFEVAFGAPAEEIAELASKIDADLIVLPSHGRSGLARLMIGSVAERVVRMAHCPVLVLRD